MCQALPETVAVSHWNNGLRDVWAVILRPL